MSAKSTRGIVSPWAKKPVDAIPATAMQAEPLKEYDNSVTEYITLDGQISRLHLSYLHSKEIDSFTEAATNFGECLKTLFEKAPAFRTALNTQSISSSPPLGPKIKFTFGSITLYAKASTREFELAQKMAIDRLCLALSEVRGSKEGKKILEDFQVRVGVKT